MTLSAFLKDHPKKVLIFDFDHTLAALDLPWDEYLNEVNRILAEFYPEFAAKYPQGVNFEHNLLDIAIQTHGEPLRQKLNEYAAKFESEKLQGWREDKEMTDFIRQNHGKYEFYLWSSNMLSTVKPILSEIGLLSLFKDLITRDRVPLLKPDPSGFDIIHKNAPYEKSEYLMIGDSTADKIAAESAGIEYFKAEYFEV